MNLRFGMGAILASIMLQTNFCSAQMYVTTGGEFHVPIMTQQSPEYFSFVEEGPAVVGGNNFFNGTDNRVNLQNSKFSVAQGLNLHGAIGYTTKKLISFELGTSYFTNTKKQFSAFPQSSFSANGTSDWNYKNYSLLPAVAIGKRINKSDIRIKLFAGIGLSDLDVESYTRTYGSGEDKQFVRYSFGRSISYSYGFGLEYEYPVTDRIQLMANTGICNTYYTPKHADLVNTSRTYENLTVYQKEIDYEKNVKDTKVLYDPFRGEYGYDPEKPEVRAQETLKLNSFYFGIGLKFTFTGNEEK